MAHTPVGHGGSVKQSIPMKKLLLLLLGIVGTLPIFARDFEYTYEGQTLVYTVLDEEAKTCEPRNGDFRGGGNQVAGTLIIPAAAKDGDVEYFVIAIGTYAFCDCSGLTSVAIPNSVTSIGSYAFCRCSGLTSVTIPNSVTSIGSYAFCRCSELTSVTIPNSVTDIGKGTFSNCTVLPSVTIPNSVTSIGDEAFSGCSGLISVMIPNSVTFIGKGAFSNCTALPSIALPNSVTTIGESVFSDCSGLTTVEIPNSITTIGENAFNGCSGLASVTLPNSVTTIGDYAFYNCTGITSVTIPASVTSIGNYAFYCSMKLAEIIVEEGNREYSSLDGVLFNFDKTKLIQYPTGKTSDEYVIPNTVTDISAFAFYFCSLTKVVMSPSVLSIGPAAFGTCKRLVTLILGPNIQEIQTNGFIFCPITSIYITAPTPPGLYPDVFCLPSEVNRTAIFQNVATGNRYYYDNEYGWYCWHTYVFYPDFNPNCDDYTLMTEPTELRVEDCSPLTGRPGDTFRLSAKLYPEDVTLPYVFWRSTDPEIASVDSDGLVTIHADLRDAMPADEGDESQPACKIIAETLYYDGPVVEIPVVYNQSAGITDLIGGESCSDIDSNAPAEVFTLQGTKVSDSVDKLSAGIYIVRQGNKVKKIAVR